MTTDEIRNGAVRLKKPFPRAMSDTQRINAAIQKWEVIARFHAMASEGTVLNGVCWETCALCAKYQRRDECHGCPVAKKVGCGSCEKTPFVAYQNNPSAANARREVAFLRTLLKQRGAR